MGVRAGDRPTIADGIAVKHPGDVTQPLLDAYLDDLVTVGEDDIAEAMFLLPRAREARRGGRRRGRRWPRCSPGTRRRPRRARPSRSSAAATSTPSLLAAVARRHESISGRRLVLLTRIPDRPGGLARLLEAVATTGANLVDVSHVREGVDLHVRETAVELILETRGREHADAVMAALEDAGYGVAVIR